MTEPQKQTEKPKTKYPKRPKPTASWPMFWKVDGQGRGYWTATVHYKQWRFGRRGSPDLKIDGHDFDLEAQQDYDKHIVSIKAGNGKVDELANGLETCELCALFLESREQLHQTGEIADRTWRDYQRIAAIVAKHFGKRFVETLTPADFGRYRQELAKDRNVVTLANLVRVSRVIFRYAKAGGHLAHYPDFGDAFKEPSRKNMRKERNHQQRTHGLKMFEADQIRTILDHQKTSAQMRAMILLGINCAYGNKDCSELLRPQIVQRDGVWWLEAERSKTQVERRCPLWPETVAALKVVAEIRPPAASSADEPRVFLTKYGLRWVRDATSSNDEIAKSFSRLLSKIKTGEEDDGTPIFMKRVGLSFYALRHTVETIGDRVRDKNALNLILGHVDASMAAIYRERIDDDRLLAVTDYVRAWLWPPRNPDTEKKL